LTTHPPARTAANGFLSLRTAATSGW
jgi:hypothetical protein